MTNFLGTIEFFLVKIKYFLAKILFLLAKISGFPDPKTFYEIMGMIIGLFLFFLSIVFLLVLVRGGFIWIRFYGDNVKALESKKIIINSFLGTIITIILYFFSFSVFHSLATATF